MIVEAQVLHDRPRLGIIDPTVLTGLGGFKVRSKQSPG
jgi:hypothetical protein